MADRSIHVGRELLDETVVDRRSTPMGCVDDIVIEIPRKGRPRVTHLELGGDAIARGLSWPFAPLVRWMARRWGAARGAPFRIEWRCVTKVDRELHVDLAVDDTPAHHWERVVRDRIITHIPGA